MYDWVRVRNGRSSGDSKRGVLAVAYRYDGHYGSYLVLDSRIGEGSFCIVDRVRGVCTVDVPIEDAATGAKGPSKARERVYAAKVFDLAKTAELAPEGRRVVFERFRDEILSLHALFIDRNLRHRHIVAVPDHHISERHEEGHSFGLIEYATCDLAVQTDFERRGLLRRFFGRFRGMVSFGVVEKLRQFKGMASALALLHGMGIVHRDVKPQNILVVGRILKLSDMGLAEAEAAHGTSLGGTPRYAAPEFHQRFYRGSVHPGSDVFSWATAFYEYLTGRYPFEALDVETSISRLQQKIYPPLATVGVRGASKQLEARLDRDVFSRCFSPTPEVRPTAPELVAILDTVLT